MSDSVQQQLDELTARLQTVEDQLAITNLIHSYGPAVDTGSAAATAALFTDDGVYDVDTGELSGRAAIAEMVQGDPHQGLIHRGCAHVMSAPSIALNGDRASVVSYSQLLIKKSDGSGFVVYRATANKWELRRGAAGWQITHRTARFLDGGDEARAVLGSLTD